MAETNIREALEAFDHLEKELTAERLREAVDPCEIYREVKPWISRILPWIDKISKKVGDVIRLLMQIADKCCKA